MIRGTCKTFSEEIIGFSGSSSMANLFASTINQSQISNKNDSRDCDAFGVREAINNYK